MCSEHVYLKFKLILRMAKHQQALLTKKTFIPTRVIEILKLLKTVMQPNGFHWANLKTWFRKTFSIYKVSLILSRKNSYSTEKFHKFQEKKNPY